MLRRALLVLPIVLATTAPGVVSAATTKTATYLGDTALSSSSARDANAAGRIVVWGPSGVPLPALQGLILLPPQPGGETLVLPCSAPSSCPQELDVPRGLGASGRVIGFTAQSIAPTLSFARAATWDASGSVRTLLAPLSSSPFDVYLSQALHLNASDVIVGQARSPTLGVNVPVIWSSPTAVPVPLANLGTNRGPYPTRISDGGVIIGNDTGPLSSRAVLWPSAAGTFVYLGELPGGTGSTAMDLDEEGRVVGSSNSLSTPGRAVLWRPSGGGYTVETLPVPFAGGSCSEATAIEPGGWIAGNCEKAAPFHEKRGVIWRDVGGVVTFEYELLPLGGDANTSAAYGLSGGSLALGSSGYPARAVVWDLDSPSPPEAPALGPAGLVLLATSLALAALRSSAGRR